MNREYWKLFWTTGMPEAWLMSRDGEIPSPAGPDQGFGQGMLGPLAGAPFPLTGNMPGSPGNPY
ncbi:MAG: hypothetical protein K2K53_00180 [Oscillospiraceae bacterium]|nr:hypothetical protein [Oscillospiraceae bacterium]